MFWKNWKIMSKTDSAGWCWRAFILGPFWYLTKGMCKKGLWLLAVCVVSAGAAIPFVLVYCGARGKSDWYEYKLKESCKINLDEL